MTVTTLQRFHLRKLTVSLIILLWAKWNITDRMMTSLLVANHPQDALINEQMSTTRSPVLGHKGLPVPLKNHTTCLSSLTFYPDT